MMLFVAGLAGDFDDVDLKEMFELYGEVASAKLITDRATGKSKGFGFVEMPNEAEAKETITTLDGVMLQRKKISVKEAEAQQPRTGGSGGGYNRDNNSGGFNNSRSYNSNNSGYGTGGSSSSRPRKPYTPGGDSSSGGGFNRDRNTGGGYNSGGYNRDNNSGGGYNSGGFNRDRNNDNRDKGTGGDKEDFNKRY